MPFGVLGKLVGGLAFIVGLSIILGFPWVSKFQPEKLSNAGILFGFILLAIGLYLILV